MVGFLGEVLVLKTTDRATGVSALLKSFGLADYAGKQVAVKDNFNSADPFPASTHLETLGAIVETLKGAGAGGITLAERAAWAIPRRCLKRWASLNYRGNWGLTRLF